MTRTRAKICGIRDRDDLELAVKAGADAVGLLCSVPIDSPREIPLDRARRLVEATPPFVTAVLVTMPADLATARELVETVRPDAIQCHGDLAPAAVASLAADLPTIMAVEATDEEAIARYREHADALLLDSTDDAGAGGTGTTHDWDRARSIVADLSIPVILAGGLTPENVERAIEVVEPYAVDVASGVDGSDGKDPEAVREFLAGVRAGARGRVQP